MEMAPSVGSVEMVKVIDVDPSANSSNTSVKTKDSIHVIKRGELKYQDPFHLYGWMVNEVGLLGLTKAVIHLGRDHQRLMRDVICSDRGGVERARMRQGLGKPFYA